MKDTRDMVLLENWMQLVFYIGYVLSVFRPWRILDQDD